MAVATIGVLRAFGLHAGTGVWRRRAVGIDVGTRAVKVVALSQGRLRRDVRLEGCAIEPCDIANGDPGADIAIGQGAALRRALARAGLRARDAVLGVPDRATRSASAVVPASSTVEARRWDAEDVAYGLFPPPAQPCFDVIARPIAQAPHVDLHVIAASSAMAVSRIAVAASADVRIAVLDLDSFAMQRALACGGTESGSQGRGLVLVDLGAGHPGALFFRAQMPPTWLPLQPAAMEAALNDAAALAAAIVDAMSRYRATPEGRVETPPARIVLAGGGATRPGLREAVVASTGLPTAIADPFAGIRTAPTVDRMEVAQALPAYLLGTGLALRGLL